MEKAKLEMLKEKALNIRLGALEGIYSASSGHPGGSLAIADILSYLYFSEMNVNPENPCSPKGTQLPLSMRRLRKKGILTNPFFLHSANSEASFKVIPI